MFCSPPPVDPAAPVASTVGGGNSVHGCSWSAGQNLVTTVIEIGTSGREIVADLPINPPVLNHQVSKTIKFHPFCMDLTVNSCSSFRRDRPNIFSLRWTSLLIRSIRLRHAVACMTVSTFRFRWMSWLVCSLYLIMQSL